MANVPAAGWDPINGRPASPAEAETIRSLKDHFAELRAHIVGTTPPSREQSLALTHLEDAAMRATRAVLQPWPTGSAPPEQLTTEQLGAIAVERARARQE